MFLASNKVLNKILKKTISTQYTERMAEILNKNYKECVDKLNTLQTNRNVLNGITVPNSHKSGEKLGKVRDYLLRSGITSNDLDKLRVIHVSGTKGKGSTCAYCESILRHHGYKTGFFSSPHLIEVRERIRINGVPILKDNFAKYFWNVYDNLDKHKDDINDIPFYFQFLFIMAVQVFLKENVDVAIIEVGIGGEYDPTNVVTNVPVAGITSLGYDHISVLGNTLESISWNKAGIMKKGSKVFTIPQPENALKVLHDRSIEKECNLTIVENINHFPIIQSFASSIQCNINLAIKMAETWMLLNPKQNNNSFIDSDTLIESIKNCIWPGRYEIIQNKNIRFYIDGAHTLESMSLCINWYLNDTKKQTGKNALLFNLTGGRSCEDFFNLFKNCNFDTVIFVPNIAKTSNEDSDNLNLVLPIGQQMSNCYIHKKKWSSMNFNTENIEVFESVDDALNYLNKKGKYNLLVTGSLYLVGATLTLVNPDLNGCLQNNEIFS